ncbi:MerR family transcriptional regulator [Nocardia brasiliensis]|uniref:MerR family transcriptional regulator n=1 Tax=Nocardia brasiliensis TaxID=37326 RepID=UPI001893C737|nr:MerR family transcriptional regulator [Nocardia brasiliensis]MBF6131043.1 MerR family transcriptional regulator [Nocardia brasiliensis]
MTEDTPAGGLVSIGELARRTGFSVRTIRFYCDEGILQPQRSAGGHRMFDADHATERLLLVRQLRALGLGLDSITGVLHEQRSLTEVIAAESARLDDELRTLAWRRASLQAVEMTSAAERTERLALLAAAQDGAALHETLVRFWQRVLAPLPRSASDPWIYWNVPEPPAAPSVDQVVAYAELVALTAAPGMSNAVRRQYWRQRPERIRDPYALYREMGELMVEVVDRVSAGTPPQPGDELDRFVTAHAQARGEQDSTAFRQQLLTDATDSDTRIHHYWTLTAHLLESRITIGQAHNWLYNALAQSA